MSPQVLASCRQRGKRDKSRCEFIKTVSRSTGEAFSGWASLQLLVSGETGKTYSVHEGSLGRAEQGSPNRHTPRCRCQRNFSHDDGMEKEADHAFTRPLSNELEDVFTMEDGTRGHAGSMDLHVLQRYGVLQVWSITYTRHTLPLGSPHLSQVERPWLL